MNSSIVSPRNSLYCGSNTKYGPVCGRDDLRNVEIEVAVYRSVDTGRLVQV